MPKSLIVYFSLGGTTAQVARSIASGLKAAGYSVDLHDLADGLPPDSGGYDLLGVGSPTHYFRLPFNVTDYVEGLPFLDGLPAFAFVLHGTNQGDAGNTLRRALVRKGGREVGYLHTPGADIVSAYLKLGYLFSPDRPNSHDLVRAQEFGRAVAAHAVGREYVRPQDDPSPSAVYRLERFLSNRWLVRHLHSRLFLVDEDRCDTCGICVQECPTGNISSEARGCPDWGRNCLGCLRCELVCPNEAITSPATRPLFLPLAKYNVRQASRDPSMEHMRVKFSQGRIEQL